MSTKQRFKGWWKGNPAFRAHFWRVFRFGIVGAICTALHYGVYCLCLLFANANVSYTVGYVVGLLCNYVLTTYFTFQSKATRGNVAGFVASHAVNYLMEIGLLNLFLWLNVSKWLAPIVVMAIAVPINFLLLNVVYKKRSKE